MNKQDYAKYIDHTLLKPEATAVELDKFVADAVQYHFKTVCVNSAWVPYTKKLLGKSDVGLTATVGFPLGAMASEVKAFEADWSIKHGADEIDMVINIGQLKGKNYEYVLQDIKKVREASKGHVLKVIIETALLSTDEAKKATEIVLASGADFVKTSTGFSTRGASADDVKLLKSIVGDKIGIKAAGGVKTFAEMQKMIELGATRIGTSSGVKLLLDMEVKSGY